MNKAGFVYIMTNKNRTTLYIGVTNDLCRRIYEHKNHLIKNSFTDKYNIEYCIYYEEFTYFDLAIQREKELKKWNRQKKEDLINKKNPEWNILVTERGFVREKVSFSQQVDDILKEGQMNKQVPPISPQKSKSHSWQSEETRGIPPVGRDDGAKGKEIPPVGRDDGAKGKGIPPVGRDDGAKGKEIPPVGREDGAKGKEIPPVGREDGAKGKGIPPVGRNDGAKSKGIPSVGRNDGAKSKGIPPVGRNDGAKSKGIPPVGRNDGAKGKGIPSVGRNDGAKGKGIPPVGRNDERLHGLKGENGGGLAAILSPSSPSEAAVISSEARNLFYQSVAVISSEARNLNDKNDCHSERSEETNIIKGNNNE